MAENIIEIHNLVYEYGAGTPFHKVAVNDVSLCIKNGSITGIIGHTGSGKSTLVQMLNGLLTPQSGTVLLEGENIFESKKKLHQVRFQVGIVFQYPEYQLFEETVRKDIAFGPKNMMLSEQEINERVTKAAEFAGVEEEWLEKSPFDLSGGQKRRVAIAGVMAMQPKVLILDEPASGLDPYGRKSIFDGLLKYREKTGSTVIIVSHSMEDMARYADEIIVMSNGTMLTHGSRDEVFGKAELLMSNGLDLPQITHIVLHLRQLGINLPENIYTVEAAKEAILKLYGGNKND